MKLSDRILKLAEGYYLLRNQSEGLKKHSFRFEGVPWQQDDDAIKRSSDGWSLRVYEIEGNVGATVYEPNGMFSTYS